MEERGAYIALNMVHRIGAVTVANGVEALCSAVAFFKAGGSALRGVRGISRDIPLRTAKPDNFPRKKILQI